MVRKKINSLNAIDTFRMIADAYDRSERIPKSIYETERCIEMDKIKKTIKRHRYNKPVNKDMYMKVRCCYEQWHDDIMVIIKGMSYGTDIINGKYTLDGIVEMKIDNNLLDRYIYLCKCLIIIERWFVRIIERAPSHKSEYFDRWYDRECKRNCNGYSSYILPLYIPVVKNRTKWDNFKMKHRDYIESVKG